MLIQQIKYLLFLKKPQKTVLTKEQKALIDYLDSHSVEIYRDKNGKMIAKITKDQ